VIKIRRPDREKVFELGGSFCCLLPRVQVYPSSYYITMDPNMQVMGMYMEQMKRKGNHKVWPFLPKHLPQINASFIMQYIGTCTKNGGVELSAE